MSSSKQRVKQDSLANEVRLVSLLLPLTTFLVLFYEIALTRLFAYIFTYHLTALAVSFAMFGLGSGAYIRARWLAPLPQQTLVILAHLATAVTLLALYASLLFTHNAVVIVSISALPFVCAGIAVSHYYETRRAAHAAATYALDLTGAAIACIAGLIILTHIGADGALLWLAGFSGTTAILAAFRVETARRNPWLASAVLCLLLPIIAYPLRTHWPDPLLNRHSSPDKQLPRVLREHGTVTDSAWSAVGRADLFETPGEPDKIILTDAMNATIFLGSAPDGLPDLFAAVPYKIAPVRNALILGSGAGLEVRIARDAGVPDIEAVELNDAIIRLVRRWQTFGGPVYDQPGVKLFVEEGRKFILTSSRRYDLIQMSLVLTATAQSGTYALAEGYLYTREAFESYLQHLESTGALVMIDDSFERTLKNTVTAVSVMEQTLGLTSQDAMKRIAVLFDPNAKNSGYKYQLIVSPAPLSDERLHRLTTETARRHLQLLWLPGVTAASQFQSLANAGAKSFIQSATLNYEPPTDDKPFFNNFAKTPAQFLPIVRPYLLLSALMLAVLIALFTFNGLKLGATGRRPTALAALYGTGFMFIELGLLHKLTLAVGGPTRVLSVLLFALLLYCGLGSLASSRFTSHQRTRFGSFAIFVVIIGLITTAVIEHHYQLQGLTSTTTRIACVLAILAPIGLCLGAPFPHLLRRHGQTDQRQIAYLWAVNGVGSVLGGSLTLILLPLIGGRALLLTGSALYLLAWLIDRQNAITTKRPA